MSVKDIDKEVRDIQLKLVAKGFLNKDQVDGIFGKVTKAAVIKFQKSVNLFPDGIVGPDTHAALNGDIVKTIFTKEFLDTNLDDRTNRMIATLDTKAKAIFLPFIKKAKEVAASMGFSYIAISGHRGKEEQNALYAKGRTKPGNIVTNATFGYSNHNFGIALDFGVFKNGTYIDDKDSATATKVHKAVAKIAGAFGIDAGANWTSIKDYPHFEVKTNLSLAQKRDLYAKFGSVL